MLMHSLWLMRLASFVGVIYLYSSFFLSLMVELYFYVYFADYVRSYYRDC